jgi:hypothetical protein
MLFGLIQVRGSQYSYGQLQNQFAVAHELPGPQRILNEKSPRGQNVSAGINVGVFVVAFMHLFWYIDP